MPAANKYEFHHTRHRVSRTVVLHNILSYWYAFAGKILFRARLVREMLSFLGGKYYPIIG